MSAKIELSLAPAKAKGLSEDERLDLGRLLKITSRRTRNGCMILFTFCGMWQMPQGLRLQSALS